MAIAEAQEKITLRYLGTAVNQDKAIAEKFEADTGIKTRKATPGDEAKPEPEAVAYG